MLREIKNTGMTSTKSGFTLIELIMVACMLGIVSAAIVGSVGSSYKDWKVGSARSTVLQDGRAAMSQMARLLRQAKGFVSASSPDDQAGYVTFALGVNGNFGRFQLNTQTSELEYGQPGSVSPLVGPVTRLVFQCYDLNEDLIDDLSQIDRIRSVHIEATFVDEQDESITFTLSERIFCQKDFQYVVINEIMYKPDNPPGTDEEPYEWVELYNFGKRSVNLTGWRIWTKDPTKTDLLRPHPQFGNSSMTIAAGGYAVITTDNTEVTGVDQNAVWLSTGDDNIGQGLSNGSKEEPPKKPKKPKKKPKKKPPNPKPAQDPRVTVTDGNDQIDSVSYCYLGSWGAHGDGKTLARIDPYYGHSDDPENWKPQNGTPGRQN